MTQDEKSILVITQKTEEAMDYQDNQKPTSDLRTGDRIYVDRVDGVLTILIFKSKMPSDEGLLSF